MILLQEYRVSSSFSFEDSMLTFEENRGHLGSG